MAGNLRTCRRSRTSIRLDRMGTEQAPIGANAPCAWPSSQCRCGNWRRRRSRPRLKSLNRTTAKPGLHAPGLHAFRYLVVRRVELRMCFSQRVGGTAVRPVSCVDEPQPPLTRRQLCPVDAANPDIALSDRVVVGAPIDQGLASLDSLCSRCVRSVVMRLACGVRPAARADVHMPATAIGGPPIDDPVAWRPSGSGATTRPQA